MPMSSVLHEIAASTAAGSAATVLGHPLDCVKVRLQAAQSADLSTAACAMRMLRAEGPRAFTKGLAPPLVNSILMNTLMFVVFAEARKRLPAGSMGAIWAGAISGIATAFLSTPFDLIKIQAQLGAKESGRELLIRLLRTNSKLLYTGHTANLFREGIFTAAYLGIYAAIRDLLPDSREQAPLMFTAVTSAATGALAWVVSYPFDVIKSLQQGQQLSSTSVAHNSMWSASQRLYQIGGYSAFYRGVSASTLRAILVTCSRLVTYEAVINYFA